MCFNFFRDPTTEVIAENGAIVGAAAGFTIAAIVGSQIIAPALNKRKINDDAYTALLILSLAVILPTFSTIGSIIGYFVSGGITSMCRNSTLQGSQAGTAIESEIAEFDAPIP